MAQLPYMPLDTAAFVQDTTDLSAEETGCYLLILMKTWSNNGKPLPDDAEKLSRVARVSIARWNARVMPQLLPFFDTSEGYWRNTKLETMWSNTVNRANFASDRGRKGAAARWHLSHSDSITQPMPQAIPEQSLSNGNQNQKFKKRTLNGNSGGKWSRAASVAPKLRNPANGSNAANAPANAHPYGEPPMPARGDETSIWRMRLTWYRDNPSSWDGNWGPTPDSPRCWLLTAPDCIPYQHLLHELGLRPPT